MAGRHYLTKAEINALYFATHEMERPRGWDRPMPIGRYWRSALVVFFLGGGSRPNARFAELCELAGIRLKTDIETGEDKPWELKDLRKTCATYCDGHMPESSIEILGHSVGGITYRHYAHRAPLAFKAIMTLPQPTAFSALVRGFEGEWPCCRRRFADAS